MRSGREFDNGGEFAALVSGASPNPRGPDKLRGDAACVGSSDAPSDGANESGLGSGKMTSGAVVDRALSVLMRRPRDAAPSGGAGGASDEFRATGRGAPALRRTLVAAGGANSHRSSLSAGLCGALALIAAGGAGTRGSSLTTGLCGTPALAAELPGVVGMHAGITGDGASGAIEGATVGPTSAPMGHPGGGSGSPSMRPPSWGAASPRPADEPAAGPGNGIGGGIRDSSGGGAIRGTAGAGVKKPPSGNCHALHVCGSAWALLVSVVGGGALGGTIRGPVDRDGRSPERGAPRRRPTNASRPVWTTFLAAVTTSPPCDGYREGRGCWTWRRRSTSRG